MRRTSGPVETTSSGTSLGCSSRPFVFSLTVALPRTPHLPAIGTTGRLLPLRQMRSCGVADEKDTIAPITAQKDAAAPSPGATGSAAWLDWRRLVHLTNRAITAATLFSSLGFVALIVGLTVAATLRANSIDLQTIPVPKTLADDGFSESVATQRLRDAINEIHHRTSARVAKTTLVLRQAPLDIAIPKAGLSVESMASWLRGMLPNTWQHDVTGEFTQSGDALSLRLRVNGNVVFSDSANGPDAVSALIDKGALKLVEVIEPFVAAFSLFYDDDLHADSIADHIIATFPSDDETVAMAHSLKGSIAGRRFHARASDDYRGRQDDLAEAMAEFRQAIRLARNYPEAHLGLGNILVDLGKQEEALAEYREAIRLDSNYATPHTNLGLMLSNHGKEDDAIAEYRTAIRLDRKRSEPHHYLGNILHKRGEDAEAVAEYREAIQLDPKDAGPHVGLGYVWETQGKLDMAMAEFREAIRLDRNNADAHNGLGNVLRTRGEPDEAVAEHRAAIQLDPKLAAPHVGLGNVWYDRGKDEDAVAEYREAIRLDPKLAELHHNIGLVWTKLGKLDEAEAEFRAAIQFNPKLAQPHNGLGIVVEKQGRHDEAAAEYRAAISLDPRLEEVRFNLGRLLRRLGRNDEAVAEFREAIRLNPKDAESHHILSGIYRDQGKADEALAEYDAAIRLDPMRQLPGTPTR
ncbi:TPR repeat protein (plasmid) [Paraburkholderia caribensis MBA4]|uniref:TPR repeat protein n=1 Tax=Paraburkholderia caribensis MBA4 TaxID=1323664 RepID=A0A0P0RQZ2_9BURK|nr:TPR repeat protein [Paraburkholderia caribensis MBA4]